MAIQNITGLENPTEIAKLLQALIDQKSTINLDNLSPEGQAKFTELQNAINANSNSITTINNELSNKLEAEVLKAQNGYIKFSNGIMIQWGRINAQTTKISNVKYPISFTAIPRISYNIETIGPGITPINCDYIIEKLNTIGFIVHQATMCSFSWIAIGY